MNSLYYPVTIYRNGKFVRTQGLYDTGNRLKSIENRRGIIIIPWHIAQNLMDAEERRLGKRILRQLASSRRPFVLKEFSLISYRTIEQKTRFMPGLMIDKIKIQTIYGNVIEEKRMIGMTECGRETFARYQCLLPEDIFYNNSEQVKKVR